MYWTSDRICQCLQRHVSVNYQLLLSVFYIFIMNERDLDLKFDSLRLLVLFQSYGSLCSEIVLWKYVKMTRSVSYSLRIFSAISLRFSAIKEIRANLMTKTYIA